jgi:hypothetical protein
VRTSVPDEAFTTRTERVACRDTLKEIAVCSPLQSPFGVTAAGVAFNPVTASGRGPGTLPVAGRTAAPAPIVYV